jgi:hypothetical protein
VEDTMRYYLQRFVTTYLTAIPEICQVSMTNRSIEMYYNNSLWFPNFAQVLFCSINLFFLCLV